MVVQCGMAGMSQNAVYHQLHERPMANPWHARYRALFGLILFAVWNAAHSEVPLHLPLQKEPHAAFFNTLEAQLSEHAETPITINGGDFWQLSLNAIRRGDKGLYWVAPHFASWLVHRHKFVPVAQLEGPLYYALVVRAERTDLFDLTDLAGSVVCTQHAMNMDSLFASRTLNPLPRSVQRAVTWSVGERLRTDDERCDALVISNTQWQEAQRQTPGQWIKLAQSQTTGNYSLVAHPELGEVDIAAIKTWVNDPANASLLNPLWHSISEDGAMKQEEQISIAEDALAPLLPYWQSER